VVTGQKVVSHQLQVERRFAGRRQTFYHCATPTSW